MAELQAEGRGGPDDDTMVGREIRGGGWHDGAGFAALVAQLRADADLGTPRPDGLVPCTTWWWCAGSTYLGRIAVRYRLTEHARRRAPTRAPSGSTARW
jgi:predicted acetyltransferase